jgi:hypothetical protein
MEYDAHYPDFVKAMVHMLVTFGVMNGNSEKEVIMIRIDGYWELLDHLPWENFRRGLHLACQHATKGFPYPGVILEHAAFLDPAEVARLRSLPYEAYLQTDHWHNIRSEALQRARFRCQLCNADAPLHVHHRSYAHRGEEQLHMEDIITLCGRREGKKRSAPT